MTLAKIIYGSLTGNTEEMADIVCEALEKLDIEVEIDECTQVDAAEFNNADICVVGAYTYDEGTIPEEMLDLYEDLQELDLNGKVFGVCGSGDTFYEYYATAVDKFEEAFLTAGAKKGTEKIKVDLAAEKEDVQRLEAFASELVTACQAM
ncbi:flavodoxin [Tetragenococcus osmophilus]|uniref:Flavodoxin n=1 Tax=Tetragenococcus osmophilus TaxID=526944 RepID=A0AA38CY18_9ENTE|nr:flavodoxin [Tetragenococcus osmophilus]AYW48209.1 flavodoxin [Tetragenococcus osmophilus]GMA53988.1 flavodoxin [Alicyclobacillus contaminans]GMA72114.1 flavodoxin [Tetragenococcus osmophilus]